MITKNNGTQRVTALILGVMGLSLILFSPQASAFFKKRSAEQTPAEAVDRNLYPSMVFERGILQEDFNGQWRLGNTSLIMNEKSRVSNADQGPNAQVLEAGKEAIVMGYWIQDHLVVYQASVLSNRQTMDQGRYYEGKSGSQPRMADPNIPR